MLMLISPSKTQAFDGTRLAQYSLPVNLDHSQVLVDRLQRFTAAQLGELMQVSPKLAELNYQRYRDFQLPFNRENARQAVLAFKGDVYNGIDTEHYTDGDFAFAQKHLRILSGLYGVLKPLDLIQPYRLEMGTKFATDRGQTLYDFWGSVVTEGLNQDIESDFGGTTTVVNLASNEYYKAIKPRQLQAQVLNILFKQNKNGVYKVIGIHAKRARGLMVNFAIKHRLAKPQDLQGFNAEGYQFNPDFSKATEWVFCRDLLNPKNS